MIPANRRGLASRKDETMSIARPDPNEIRDDEAATPAVPGRLASTRGVRMGKRAEDTAAGCRANAAADTLRASAPGVDHVRMRMEHSAAAWTARADLLERLEKKFQARARAA
jgi:hypothetical protein